MSSRNAIFLHFISYLVGFFVCLFVCLFVFFFVLAGPTVVIAELNGGAIVGGYTTQAWDGSNQYKSDPKAFLWGISKNGQLYKSDPNPTNVRYSIYTGNNYAPTFGSGHDFQIQNNFQHVSANPGTFTQSAKGGYVAL